MDIDIDFKSRTDALNLFKHRVAVRDNNGELVKHNTGVYFHDIPYNPITNCATIDYKTGEQRGYFKIDFLNIHAYEHVRDEEHLIKLLNQEPIWELLAEETIVKQLFHISQYGVILRTMKPRSIEQLAAVLAMIRPGKKHLIGQPWSTVINEIWHHDNHDGYVFRKSHAIAYAMVVVVQLNALVEHLTNSLD